MPFKQDNTYEEDNLPAWDSKILDQIDSHVERCNWDIDARIFDLLKDEAVMAPRFCERKKALISEGIEDILYTEIEYLADELEHDGFFEKYEKELRAILYEEGLFDEEDNIGEDEIEDKIRDTMNEIKEYSEYECKRYWIGVDGRIKQYIADYVISLRTDIEPVAAPSPFTPAPTSLSSMSEFKFSVPTKPTERLSFPPWFVMPKLPVLPEFDTEDGTEADVLVADKAD